MTEWALVTGGSRNIGAAIAARLQEDGFKVMVASRTPPEHEDFDEFVPINLEDPAAAAASLQTALDGRPCTRFVHNAAITNEDLTTEVSLDVVMRIYAVNLAAFIGLSQIVIPLMRDAEVGRIVAIGSRAGLGKVRRVAYAASKSGLSGAIRTMALELGAFGITVNCVAPGPIETSMFRASTTPGSQDYINLNKGIPVGYVGDPADVAHAVSYFVSDKARFCTGQTMYVCGGTSVAFADPNRPEVRHRFSGAFPAAGRT